MDIKTNNKPLLLQTAIEIYNEVTIPEDLILEINKRLHYNASRKVNHIFVSTKDLHKNIVNNIISLYSEYGYNCTFTPLDNIRIEFKTN